MADVILESWGYDDTGKAKYFRASANFVFVFRHEREKYFLRFNDSSERDLNRIESEISVFIALRESPLNIANR